MADIRLSPKDLARMEKLQGEVGKAVKALDPRQIEQVSREVSEKINGTVRNLLANLDTVADRLGVDTTEGRTTLKRGLEAAEGASANVSELAPLLSTLPMDPRVRLAILGGAAIVGGVAGYNRELARRRAVQAAAEEDARLFEDLRRAASIRDEIGRYNAARRRARSFR